ncbi:glycosyltransferase family 2 protein [Ramlibacter sp. WS9]|uniref:glycosyltransferase family 2 protein n=1 Tax=Ramlibacter sp. WS9 TaxID=1882741 RepID=UPI0011431DCD|nr:glycosyltransferase family 2 protein [Ramlibacter sp. WS9]ROZ76641.1 glycosyltransferase [Ramlibacter sp. WS9]
MTSIARAARTPAELAIVVPCYNEEAVLAETCARLLALRERLVAAHKISPRSTVVFVDDGSRDQTWDMIDGWAREGGPVMGVKLSANCGHQSALLAGLTAARGDAAVTIDADLQDDEAAIESMVDAFHEGAEVVYGVRARRDADTWFKRSSARAFYRLMAGLGVRTVHDHADYRLLSRRAIGHLHRFKEVNLFLRGVVPLLGLRSVVVRYDRRSRFAGESKYPILKMLEFALNGITSFSIAPLRAITATGFLVAFGCILAAAWALTAKFGGDALPGWASTTLPIYFLGGIQLVCAGVIGEYVGKTYMEVKQRPRFLIEEISGRDVAAPAEPARHRASSPGQAMPAARSMGVRPAVHRPHTPRGFGATRAAKGRAA